MTQGRERKKNAEDRDWKGKVCVCQGRFTGGRELTLRTPPTGLRHYNTITPWLFSQKLTQLRLLSVSTITRGRGGLGWREGERETDIKGREEWAVLFKQEGRGGEREKSDRARGQRRSRWEGRCEQGAWLPAGGAPATAVLLGDGGRRAQTATHAPCLAHQRK